MESIDEAHSYVETGRKKGKVTVAINVEEKAQHGVG
jgi:hypothetical protein